MSQPLKWDVEVIDEGTIGDFWICHRCGASSRQVWYDSEDRTSDPSRINPFLAGCNVDLSGDCDEAKRQIQDFINSDTH